MNRHKNIRVLIADDDALVGEMIWGTLEDIGYQVIGKAMDGQQAIEMAEKLRPDVILMDIEMPNLDGLEATHQIYDHCPTPVVVLTAYETQELVTHASEVGVGAYLVKPPNALEIERAITIAMARFDDLLKLHQLNAQLRSRNTELQQALAQIKTLSGLLPICTHCKKVRDDRGYWQQVEVYIRDHSTLEFSHGLCPDCILELYPGLLDEE